MSIVVREIRVPDDIDAVAGLYEQTVRWHSEQWPQDMRRPDLASLRTDLAADPPTAAADRCFLVAERAGRVVGLISASSRPAPDQGMDRYDGPVVYIGDIVVSQEARRAGVGARLMAAVEDWARANGAATITLQVHTGNTAASALYAQQGFRTVDIRMRKDLG
ncbi:MAG TPA: GNAT family N-acetyltransferase [Mycobacteriales bacterium]|nr:GNAT family N-acetyltransferase [Mycobacteriales bacterium]